MNKRNKGFTLIELLAVIVILAVIALIATPLIMNVINDAKKGAARDAGYNVIKAGELKAATEGIAGGNPPFHYDKTSNLDIKGTKPTKFTLNINKDMDTELKAWLNGYCVIKNYGNETVTIDESKKSESDCVTGGGSSSNKKYENGEAIYFNPETNTKCSASEYKPDNSLNENKSGCMKWYAFNDTKDSSTVNVILDHNTSAVITMHNSSDRMQNIKDELYDDTKNWNRSLNPRLIEANEIAKITGNTEFDATISGKDNEFYFDTNTDLPDQNVGPGTSEYKWLFDYMTGCAKNGCSIEGNSYGYWTSTLVTTSSNHAWLVKPIGTIGRVVLTASGSGVRPVVTISKSILS